MTLVTTRATKEAARYTAAGGREHCSACRWFYPQGTCGRIVGPVSPRGWCRFFSQQLVNNIYRPGGMAGQGAGAVSLDLIFTDGSGVLDPRIVFTRASTATYFDSAGVMRTAASGAPRFDYDPATLQLRGLLMEEARTNILLNSATLGTQSVAVTAQAYTLSFYGTGTITKSGAATGALVGTGAFPQRVSQTFTPTAGTLTCTVTGSVLNAQIEAGAFPTSYIPTTAATSTRVADAATMPIGVWFNAAIGTLEAECVTFAVALSNNLDIVGFNAGAQAETILIRISSFATNATAMSFTANTNRGGPNSGGTLVAGMPFKSAMTYDTAGLSETVCLNGTTPVTAATTGMPSGLTTLVLGPARVGPGISGYYRRLRYWPRVLSSAELAAVTA